MNARFLLTVAAAVGLSGCGLSYSRLPEVWDQAADPEATVNMERQVLNAIRCQLKYGTADVRRLQGRQLYKDGKLVSGAEDEYMPDSWGVLVQLTLQADEKSALTPGASFKDPLSNGQPFTLGVGGEVSSQNVFSHKYNWYYSAKDLAAPMVGSTCAPDFDLGPRTTSSPLVDATKLGIREWLVSAVQVINFHRSSRSSDEGIGAPLSASGTASDSSQYDNKFVVLTDANVAATWSLVKFSTPSSPLLGLTRSRTHQLIMTLAPGATSFQTTKNKNGKTIVRQVSGPSSSAIAAHDAALIGAAVSNALRPQ